MIELDTIESRKRIIAVAGGNHIGERGGLVWFTDPVTGSTLVCEPEDVSIKFIREKMEKSRDAFHIPQSARSAHAA
jgi:hypothetical protein